MKYQRGNKVLEFSYPLLSIPFLNELVVTHDGYIISCADDAKLVRDLAKHRRTPMSPPQLIPPTSPGQFFTGDGTLRRRFSHTGHGPFRALIVSNLKRCV